MQAIAGTVVETFGDLIQIWTDEIALEYDAGNISAAREMYQGIWSAVYGEDQTAALCTMLHERVGPVAFRILTS